ncbi:MAG: endonuclease/exonuclease/phosphatase family protein [Bacteroidales bacterium]|nr:endonuclease/exonuclease/phosphatase family protein [Bacteroidales bacterium]
MAKKRRSHTSAPEAENKRHSIFFWIFLFINIVAAIPLLLSYCAGFIPPSWGGALVVCSIGFKYILWVNLAFVVLWLPFNYPWSLISLSLVLLNINNIDKHLQLHSHDVPENCPNKVKVMSYNANLFGLYKDDDMKRRIAEKDEILDYIGRIQPDILCFQEYFWDKSEQLHFHTTDTLLKILNLEDSKEYYYQYFTNTNRRQYYYGLAIFSRYRIVDAAPIVTDSSSNAAMYIDIKYRSDTFRIYNLHLTSMHLDATDYSVGEQFASNNFSDPKMDKNIKKLYRKLKKSAVQRQHQVNIIREHIDSCHYPIIICGDFNDTPAGYAYNRISKKLKDSFRESGRGHGYTHHGNSMPPYRIDYILHDPNYNSFGHTVVDSLSVSDHYPIFSTLSLIKK